MKFTKFIKILIFILIILQHLWGQDSNRIKELSAMSIAELMNIKVHVASKSDESVFDAPSVISVLSKEEILRLNPRNVADILNVIPGFNLHTSNLNSPLFQFRGIHSVNDQILFLIDGHAINDRIFGTIVYFINSIPVEEIEQLEIIRGPGSAIYGANAFYAVINIVTNRHEAESGSVISKVASNNTVQGTVVYHKNMEKNKGLFFSGSISQSDGPRMDFKDRSGVTGETNCEEGYKHLYVSLKNGPFEFSGLYNSQKLGPFAGIAYYLNERTERTYATMAL
ncbi:MAG: TonB-dependent receptor plug domain-containing protein [Candidatus Marinimicrobia bacterium]|nr:TonB-dependent receptor plug domain-containing protein [Candidatus Neomarinimicrobiota bacterium]